MQPGLSTHVFLQQRLHPGLLDAIIRGLAPYGSPVIEVFAARHHFDYTDRSIVRDLATWFRDAGVQATLHQPLYMDSQWSRHVSPTLNLIDPEKSRRIDAMDEVKRALESAEQIPFTALTLHLGLKGDPWNLRALENSLTAIEHLKAFAHPLGVKILLENLQNDVTTPEHLLEILRVGHFDNVGVALDLGHAHLSGGTPAIDAAIELLRPRIAALHLHDNHGAAHQKDEHLWPAETSEKTPETIDWQNIARHLDTLPAKIPAILEITHELEETADAVTRKASATFDHQLRLTDQLQSS
ncbi:sugar phosphate isomerase/epimerase family protein [Granulicella sp. dw_53]|uniref:sugar phosphate isomerase/epimerase family protein n=1 Tax=Granulicella sp. dw_53 TaxID=2719792 RepID=UPI001BD3DCF1|nr:sugar phosphate isomerase/epimerase family protein [Granulicella sp. dw_53]